MELTYKSEGFNLTTTLNVSKVNTGAELVVKIKQGGKKDEVHGLLELDHETARALGQHLLGIAAGI